MSTAATPDAISVLAIRPFWRYAVGPTNGRNPAIPFYRYAAAKLFMDEIKRELPWAGAYMVRRRLWWRFDVVEEYRGQPIARS